MKLLAIPAKPKLATFIDKPIGIEAIFPAQLLPEYIVQNIPLIYKLSNIEKLQSNIRGLPCDAITDIILLGGRVKSSNTWLLSFSLAEHMEIGMIEEKLTASA